MGLHRGSLLMGSIAATNTIQSTNASNRKKQSVEIVQVPADLSLAFATGAVVPRSLHQWRGFSAEHVVTGTQPYSFQRSGETQYLALHDMILDDGEIAIDGMATNYTRDWRRSVSFIPKGRSAQGWVTPASRKNAFTALYFEPALISEELERRYTVTNPAPFLFVRPPPLQAALTRLETLLLAPNVDEMLAESVCLVAALEVFGIQSDPVGVGLSERHLKLVDAFVADHLADGISVSDLAVLCGLSRFHFTRAFKTATGTTPYAYVTTKRIDRARELLAESGLGIEHISGRVGFPTSAQFRRAFRARVGCSALEYRRLRRRIR
ncbi:AraC family transcriptional regulator [Sphingomonas sp. CARO-RG-8B-R24-01]|uniref:helix-turn-helix domain-containing protein n=1 Tax=Sphingomonas sp. CARO-RG-8B-R24-01 TaxID=2914831 RepID=UPI001F56EF3E